MARLSAQGDRTILGGGRGAAAMLVASGALSVQFGAALATHLFHRVGPAGAATVRLALAALALIAFSARQLSRERSSFRRADLGVAAAFGVVLGAMNLSIYEAIARIPLGVAVTIEFVGPLAVTIAASRRRTDILWAVLAGGGVVLLAQGGLSHSLRHLDPAGMGFALLAGVCWGAYMLLGAQVGRRFNGTAGLSLAMVVGAIVVMPLGIAAGGRSLIEPAVLAIGAAVALLSSVVPYSFELMAMRKVPPRVFGLLLSMHPALAALVGLAVLGQHLSATELVALVLVVAANAGSSWFDARAAAPLP